MGVWATATSGDVLRYTTTLYLNGPRQTVAYWAYHPLENIAPDLTPLYRNTRYTHILSVILGEGKVLVQIFSTKAQGRTH